METIERIRHIEENASLPAGSNEQFAVKTAFEIVPAAEAALVEA